MFPSIATTKRLMMAKIMAANIAINRAPSQPVENEDLYTASHAINAIIKARGAKVRPITVLRKKDAKSIVKE